MAQVTLGNFFQVNGKTVFGGGQTGLDTQQLLEDLTAAKQFPITQLEERIEGNTEKLAAFSELSTLLDNLKQASDFLRKPPGVDNDADDIFAYRTASVESNGATPASAFIAIEANPGALVRENTQIEIQNIAQATIQTSDAINGVTDPGADSVVGLIPAANRFTAGSLELNNGISVELEDGDTLQEIVAKVNAVKDDSGVQASIIKTGADVYRLQFSALDTGTGASFDVNNPANTAPGGVFENVAFANTQTAEDAEFTIDGVTVVSESNVVTDALEDVTFTLKQETAGAILSSDIVADNELVATGITNFINAVNDIKVFTARMNERGEDGLPTEDAILANNSTVDNILGQVNGQINRVVAGITSGDPQSLADVGITFTDFPGDAETPVVKNILELDVAKLNTALDVDFEEVMRVFAFDMQADSSLLEVFSRGNDISITNFELEIDATGQTATATFDDNGTPKTINLDYSELAGSITLTGQADTELEGLVLVYGDVSDDTIDVNLTQGIADTLFNVIENVTDDVNGAVAVEQNSIILNNDRYSDDIIRLEEQIARFRERLILQFSALESTISLVNNLLASLDAQSNAQLAAS